MVLVVPRLIVAADGTTLTVEFVVRRSFSKVTSPFNLDSPITTNALSSGSVGDVLTPTLPPLLVATRKVAALPEILE